MDREVIRERIVTAISDALECKPERVTPVASLMDDLGAESIDLLDINFRIERAFDLKISDEEMYRGSLRLKERGMLRDGKVTSEGIALIQREMPGFDLSRFRGGKLYENDLPRLITVGTIFSFMERRLAMESSR